uniref:AlNc14C128G6866 protein n=1 Tax=Albugo laibachii Nc14 TaxID=890382 RepID=F0WK11_9STRA|nr:AlNc14C128G6866 [Albugo laibachii Nc14]|eukprot:CCA21613.1 AlNc14C128G6866 [Albugo laibachii Nc14]
MLLKASGTRQVAAVGLVVKYLVAIEMPRVRFPDGAHYFTKFLWCLSPSANVALVPTFDSKLGKSSCSTLMFTFLSTYFSENALFYQNCQKVATQSLSKIKNVRRPGIEPGASRWQRDILPLNQRRFMNCMNLYKYIFQSIDTLQTTTLFAPTPL